MKEKEIRREGVKKLRYVGHIRIRIPRAALTGCLERSTNFGCQSAKFLSQLDFSAGSQGESGRESRRGAGKG